MMRGLGDVAANLDELFHDEGLVVSIEGEPRLPEHDMAFVDGGEGIQELLGAVAYFIRASSLSLRCERVPSADSAFTRMLDLGLLHYDPYVKERVEFLREALEFEAALKAVRESPPNLLVLDGSLYVKTYRRPLDCGEHRRYLQAFMRLLTVCEQEDVTLVGVSEDSASRVFLKHLSERYGIASPPYLTDVSALSIVSPGLRMHSVEFIPASPLAVPAAGQASFPEFPTLYLRPTASAHPLRVDRAPWGMAFGDVIEALVALSAGSGPFGYPVPLYLVHLDARITPAQSVWSAQQLVRRASEDGGELARALFSRTRHELRP